MLKRSIAPAVLVTAGLLYMVLLAGSGSSSLEPHPTLKAVTSGNIEWLEELLVDGTDPDHTSEGHPRALTAAVTQNDADSARLLIEHGADVTWVEDGLTYLHRAAKRGSVGTVQLLLGEGLDPCVRVSPEAGAPRDRSKNALELAVRDRNYEVISLLEEVTADCDDAGERAVADVRGVEPTDQQLGELTETLRVRGAELADQQEVRGMELDPGSGLDDLTLDEGPVIMTSNEYVLDSGDAEYGVSLRHEEHESPVDEAWLEALSGGQSYEVDSDVRTYRVWAGRAGYDIFVELGWEIPEDLELPEAVFVLFEVEGVGNVHVIGTGVAMDDLLAVADGIS